MWACLMHRLPFELKLTLPRRTEPGLGARHPGYLRLNPWGTIPTIDDEGFVLYEAAAILCYLAEKHSTCASPAPEEFGSSGEHAARRSGVE